MMRGPGVAAGCNTWKASLAGTSSATKVAGASTKATRRPAIKLDAFICLLALLSWTGIGTPGFPRRLKNKSNRQAKKHALVTALLFRLTHPSHLIAVFESRIEPQPWQYEDPASPFELCTCRAANLPRRTAARQKRRHPEAIF